MASLIDFYKQKLAPKITSLIDDWKAKPSNQIGNKLVQSGILGFNSSPGLVGVDTGKPMTEVGLQPKQSSFKPIQYANDRITNYINNTYLASARDLPKAVQQIKQPGIVNKAIGVGRLGFDVLGAVPDPTDALFAGYNYLKGTSAYGRQNPQDRNLFSPKAMEAGLLSATMEKPVGLGEAVFNNPTAQTIGNIAELPLILGAGVARAKTGEWTKRVLANEDEIVKAVNLSKNYDKYTPELQSKIFGIVDEAMRKISPKTQKELAKEVGNPTVWLQKATDFLESSYYTAKDPQLNIGFNVKAKKHIEPVAQGGDILSEAKKYKSAEEFVKASRKNTKVVGFDQLDKDIQLDTAAAIEDFMYEGRSGWSNSTLAELLDRNKVEVSDIDPKVLRSMFGESRGTSPLAVEKYSQLNTEAPPVLIANGKFVDGGHRVEAAIKSGKKSIKAVDITEVLKDAEELGKEEGYDFVKSWKTIGDEKSQLTDIYNQAKGVAQQGGLGDMNRLDSILAHYKQFPSGVDIEAVKGDFRNNPQAIKAIEQAQKEVKVQAINASNLNKKQQAIYQKMSNAKTIGELRSAETELKSLSPSKGGMPEPKIVKPLKEVYKEKLSSPMDTRIGQEMVGDVQTGKTELNKPLVSESTTPTKVTSESSLTPIISKKGKLNIERLAVDDTGKQALQDINNGIPVSVISNKSVIEKAKTAKGRNTPMSDEQMQNLLAEQLKNRQRVVDLSAKFSKAKADGASEAELGKIMLEMAQQSRTAQQGGTFAGRLLQAQNIVADNSASPMQKILALLDNAGVSEEKYLKDAVKVDWNKPTEVVQFYRKYVPPSLGEVLTEIRYTNMLSSPLTHIINTASNALQTGIVTPIEKGTTGLLDAARSALTGKERQYYARAGIDYTTGYLSSLPQALKKAYNVMAQKDISIRPDMEYVPTGVGGALQAYTTPLRALEAMDQFFKTLVEGGVTKELGNAPKKLTVTQIAKKANDEANYRLFRQSFDPKGELGQGYVLQLFDRWNSAINGLRRLPGGKWVLPFLQTPTNILKQGVEYSPLGLSTIPGAKNPIEQLSKTLIGTGVFATAYQLASSGLTSWEAPSGEKERELYYAAGLQPYSIKMGDKWVSFSKLGPLSYPIAMAASLADAERKNPDQSKVSNIGKSISGMLGFFGDQSYVRSIGDLVDAIQGGVSVGANAISGQAANIAGQLVPYKSFLTWLGRITDPTYRKAKTFTERMVKDLPGIGSTLEPYTDVYGNPSKRDLPLVNAISPAKITVEKKSELPLYNKYEQAKIQRGIEKRAGEKLLEGKGSTGGVYQYVNDDGTVKKVDVKKVTSLPESTNYERVKKDQEKWKLADDILNLPAEQQQKAFTDLGISKADAEYYQVAKDTTEAKVAYIKDQVQGVKTYDEFLKKVIPLVREVNGSSILTSGVIDWLYNNRIITADQKKQLKSLEYSNGQVRIKPTSVKKISVPEAKLPASAKTALPKVKRIRTKQYKLVVPKAK